jgi:hypothetical protein
MKKLLVKLVIGLLVLLILAGLVLSLTMNSIIKKGIELAGPQIAKVNITLDNVKVSLFSGKGELSGLVVGNPEGFKSESAIKLGRASVQVKAGSVFADKLVVKSVNIEAPEITFEGGLEKNNLTAIMANIEASTGGQKPASEGKDQAAEKKLQVDELVIRNGKIHVSLPGNDGKTTAVNLPDIELRGLGAGPEGITGAELSKKLLQIILADATKAIGSALPEMAKEAAGAALKTVESKSQEILKGAGKEATDKAKKGLKDLFSK